MTKDVAAKKEQALTPMQKAMAKRMAEMSASATSTISNQLKLGPGIITFPDLGETTAPLRCVIVDFVTRREWYDKPIDLKNPNSPACFAVGRGDSAGFSPVSSSPNPQSTTTCGSCPKNQWGTSNTGKGKACAEIRYVALMLPQANGPDDKIYTMRITPSLLKEFDKFYKNMSIRTGKLPLFFISELSPVPVGNSFSGKFSLADENPNYEYFWSRAQDADDVLKQIPDFSNATP